MKCEGLSRCNKIELKVYHVLGITQFRKLILWFEKIKHRKDNGKNENYHPSGLSVIALERYTGFLLYNAFLHITSLVFTALYFVLSAAVGWRSTFPAWYAAFLSAFNVYCIMLQRANYLKIKEVRGKYCSRILRKSRMCGTDIPDSIYASEPEKREADLDVMRRLCEAIEGKRDCVLSSTDADSLNRIYAYLMPALDSRPKRASKKDTDAGLIKACERFSGPYSALQRYADDLQRMLHRKGRKMLDAASIITKDAECEALYRKIFPEDTVYGFYLVYCLIGRLSDNMKIRCAETE